MPFIAIPARVHLCIPLFGCILDRGRRVDDGSLAHEQLPLFEQRAHLCKELRRQFVPLRESAELQEKRRIWNGVLALGPALQSSAAHGCRRAQLQAPLPPAHRIAVENAAASSSPTPPADPLG